MKHCDKGNSHPDTGAAANVIGLSTFISGNWYNVGWYTKNCIDKSVDQLKFLNKFCGLLRFFYRDLPECRHPISTPEQEASLHNDPVSIIKVC